VKNRFSAPRALIILAVLLLGACGAEAPPEPTVEPLATVAPRPEIYAEFALTTDLSLMTENQLEMVGLLIQAAEIMDDLFWRQAYGDDYEEWLTSIGVDETRLFAEQNYGPWDRLDSNKPFMEGVGPKPLGANFYPADMTREEFQAVYLPGKDSLYTLVQRNDEGKLRSVPYHVAYAQELTQAAQLLHQAADLADNQNFANYLKLRAAALVSDDFYLSDLYWMDVKDNEIELIIGPIETYEDKLFGYKAAYEAYVLVKDLDWSIRLARFATFLPELQRGLPVPDEYKQEPAGSDADLNAYDVIYYAGYSNSGAKTIAVNLPNDEQVQLEKGTRRLQLKNTMRAKFDKILEPIADVLIDDSQRQHISFDAFFANTMFHEVAHGLGIKNTIDGERSVREALLEYHSSMEEGKADVLGLYMVNELQKAGELGDVDMRDYYVTFMASIFRSIRFGASEAHGKANMVRFNFFADQGAFVRDAESGKYRVNFDRMEEAMTALSRKLLMLQGDGDYDAVAELTNSKGVIGKQLQADLDRLLSADIPVDVIFEQGVHVLGLH